MAGYVAPSGNKPNGMDSLRTLLNIKQPALELAGLRQGRADELHDRILTGQGDARDQALLNDVEGEMASDPNTGTAAQSQVRNTENQLRSETMYARPEAAQRRAEDKANAMEQMLAPIMAKSGADIAHENVVQTGQQEKQRIANEGLIGAADAKARGTNTPKMFPGLITKVAERGQRIAILQKLMADKNRSKYIGPINGPLNAFKQHVPLMPGDKGFGDFSSDTSNITSGTIQDITGAAMGKEEEKRIKGQIPALNDQDNVWDSKAANMLKNLRGMNVRAALLQAGVPANVLQNYQVDQLEAIAEELYNQHGHGGAFGGIPQQADEQDVINDPNWGAR